jgi:plasmid replication initiation protein
VNTKPSTKRAKGAKPEKIVVELPAESTEPPSQGDLFRADLSNWPLKDDIASMEFPVFSLSKNADTRVREYRRGNRYVRIAPSADGAATVFDKDLLLFVASQIVEQMNINKARGDDRPVSRTVVVDSIDFLLATKRGDGSSQYERIVEMLRRLRGTTIETNIATGGKTQTKGFALVDSYEVLSEKKTVKVKPNKVTGRDEEVAVSRVLSFKVTVSEWLYEGLKNFEVLTLDRQYFSLTSSIERRLCEIARKHCGDQAIFKLDIDLLAGKVGTRGQRFKFRDQLRDVIATDSLPQYRMALDTGVSPDDVVFYTRDTGKLHAELARLPNGLKWYESLERADNASAWRKPKRAGGMTSQPSFEDV